MDIVERLVLRLIEVLSDSRLVTALEAVCLYAVGRCCVEVLEKVEVEVEV